MNRPMPDKTIIRPSATPPEQSSLDEPPQPVNWGRRVLVALSLLGFAGLGAGVVYFIVGQTITEQEQKPVLIAPPRENAPVAPVTVKPDIKLPEAGGEDLPKTSPAPENGGGTSSGKPVPDNPPPVLPDQPQQQDVLKPEDRIRNYVTSYQAGDCMYLQPVRIASKSAVIEGFASRTPPFISFDSDFTQSQGFEAKIQVNLVSDKQCPAIAFLRATPQGSDKTKLNLDMQRTVIPNGSTMAGRISGYDRSTGSLGLLFVSSSGSVSNLSSFLKSDDGGAGFVVPLNLETLAEETGLIIAMVGPDLQQSLAKRTETQAAAFFENLMKDIPILRATATTVKVVP